MNPTLSRRSNGAAAQCIGELMRQGIEHPEVLSLAAGFVDSETLPSAIVADISAKVFADDQAAHAALQYDTPAGNRSLRELLRQYVADQDGVELESAPPIDQFVVTAGANQYLSLLCETLFDPGDICLVAGPTYFVFLGTLQGVLAEPHWVDTDRQGIVPAALEQTFEQLESAGQLSRVRAIYVVSEHDNPGGTHPSQARREAILDVVARWRRKQPLLLIEDAAYRELNYDGRAEPSFRQLDESGDAVVYTQTFSKSFSPGLRVGFGCGPAALTKAILDRKSNEDFGSPHLNQCIMAEALASGVLKEHVEHLRGSYRVKRDAMLAALSANFDADTGVTWSEPEGGLYVWVRFPDAIDTSTDDHLWNAAVHEQQVMYVPGDLCYAAYHGPTGTRQRPKNHARLSFGVLPPDRIADGVGRLREAFSSCASR